MTIATRPTGTEPCGCWIRPSGSSSTAEGLLPATAKRTSAAESEIVTPVQVLYEVYRWAQRHVGDATAMEIVAHLEFTRFVPGGCHDRGRRRAAECRPRVGRGGRDDLRDGSLQRCELVTADADFRGLPGVILLERSPRSEPARPRSARAAGHAAPARGRATPTPRGASACTPRSTGSSATRSARVARADTRRGRVAGRRYRAVGRRA